MWIISIKECVKIITYLQNRRLFRCLFQWPIQSMRLGQCTGPVYIFTYINEINTYKYILIKLGKIFIFAYLLQKIMKILWAGKYKIGKTKMYFRAINKWSQRNVWTGQSIFLGQSINRANFSILRAHSWNSSMTIVMIYRKLLKLGGTYQQNH